MKREREREMYLVLVEVLLLVQCLVLRTLTANLFRILAIYWDKNNLQIFGLISVIKLQNDT